MHGLQLKNQWQDHHNIELHPSLQNLQRKVSERIFLVNLLGGKTLARKLMLSLSYIRFSFKSIMHFFEKTY